MRRLMAAAEASDAGSSRYFQYRYGRSYLAAHRLNGQVYWVVLTFWRWRRTGSEALTTMPSGGEGTWDGELVALSSATPVIFIISQPIWRQCGGGRSLLDTASEPYRDRGLRCNLHALG